MGEVSGPDAAGAADAADAPDAADAADAAATPGAAGLTVGRVGFARIDAAAITVEECAEAVGSTSTGAVVTFAGVVRDHDDGRGVLRLEYTAHPSAEAAIGAVASRVAAEFPSVTVAVAHRIGALEVGDVALACAAASAHRAEAFAACARLVDAVKESVPIWKHQRFADGTSEWVASLG